MTDINDNYFTIVEELGHLKERISVEMCNDESKWMIQMEFSDGYEGGGGITLLTEEDAKAVLMVC